MQLLQEQLHHAGSTNPLSFGIRHEQMSTKRLNSLKEGNVIFTDEIHEEKLFLLNWEKEKEREINCYCEDEHNSLINYIELRRNNIE